MLNDLDGPLDKTESGHRSSPLGELTAPRNRQPVPLIGREEDITAVTSKLQGTETRLLSLIGPAGVGKTRLAQAVMHTTRSDFLQTIWVELAPVNDPEQVMPVIAHNCGVRDGPSGLLLQRLSNSIGARRILLILDNCEHVLGALKELSTLLELCPNIKVLATSRERLRLRWEWTYTVPFLGMPSHADSVSPERLVLVPSVSLFIRHLQNNIRGFLLSAENAQTVSDVCTRLGGLPLAIELAASGVPDIESLPDMLTYLDRFLNTGNSDMLDIPQRHRTLDAAIGWSYRMLSQEEQELFCRLSVFQGQWSLQQAVGICSGDGAYGQDIQRRIDRLVACSLVIENSDTNSGKRYRFLETIRVFALAQLRNTGGEQRLRRRHRDWFLAWAEQNEPLCWGQKLPLWLEQVDLDFSNFRAALQWCVETDGEAQAGLRIWSAIERYFDLFGHSTDGQPYALALLKISPELTPARAHTLAQLGVFARNQGDVAGAEALAEECYSAGLATGRIFDAVAALTVLGTLKQQKNEFADAEILLRQAVELAREYGLYEPVSLCISLVWLGIYYSLTGRVELAIPIFQEGLLKCEAAGEISFYAIALASLGRAYVGQNDLTTAKKCLERSMEASRQIHYYELYSYGLDYLGQIAWFEGHRESAVRLFASAVALRLQVGLATWIPDRNYDAILREAGTEINDAVQRLADSTSQDLLISKAWYKTLETYKQNDAAADTALTSREYEIAVKIKEGLSNQRIAGSLFISKRTVDAHVRNILDKLGLKTRAQISAWVAARGK